VAPKIASELIMVEVDLFDACVGLPEGVRYRAQLLAPDEETTLVSMFEALPFRAFEFQGFLGKRRVVSFGWRYDFNGGGLQMTQAIPAFLLPVRERAAAFAELPASSLAQVLLTEYRPGAAIGWHKDRAVFGDVVGISLLSPATFRMRCKSGRGWRRALLKLEPRSAYLLRGPVRTQWEHSIPAVERLRYSITFRTLIGRAAVG
jgi:alkylated DNA repair dioxygenase AlkB